MGILGWILAGSRSPDKIFGRYSMLGFLVLLGGFYLLMWGTYFSLSSGSLRNKVGKCVLTTATLLVLLGLIELPAALGVVDYRRVISPPENFLIGRLKPWDNPANLFDRELMHIHRPGQRIVGEVRGDLVNWLGIPTEQRYQIDVKFDSQGFRNDHEIERAPVVVIGDSFPEGVLIAQGDLLSSRLRNLLPTEVANLGQGGYGPQQELITLRRFGIKLQPKIVLWLFFEGNDLLDVVRYEHFLQDREEIAKRRDSWRERNFTRSVFNTLAGFTAPQTRGDGLEARRRSAKFIGGPSSKPETIYFAYPGVPLSEEDLKSLETAENCLLDAQKVSAENGARLVFVYVPTKFRVYHDFCEYPDDGYGKVWQPNDLPSRMATWCKAHDIPYLDLTPSLTKSAAGGELVYFPDDGHWNAKGHEVVARTVSDFLNSSGYANALR